LLAELRIDNLLLIESVHIELAAGFNVFTGETGAGKSLLVDALTFLLGARGDAEMVRPGAPQAEVTARFQIADAELADALAADLGIAFETMPAGKDAPAELVLSRTIPRQGRPRAYANGRPIALHTLRELGQRLLDIHGQHENQSLLRPATRLEMLDRFASAAAERAEVRQLHAAALSAAQALARLRHAARDRQGREDLLRFQLKEIDEARLDGLEPAAIEDEMRLLRGAEQIRQAARAAGAALDAEEGECAASCLARAAKAAGALTDAGPQAQSLRDRIESLLAEARDAAAEAEALAERARSDPERLADLEDRRARLRSLERKHGCDLSGLQTLRQRLAAELKDLDQIEVSTEQREAELAAAVKQLSDASQKLSKKRRAAARELEKKANTELADLGLSTAKLQMLLQPHEPSVSAIPAQEPRAKSQEPGPDPDEAHALLPAGLRSTGSENMELLFTANPDLPPRPLQECASGGEISRVMLALKGVLARVRGADRLPVVVFDEIDSGVGGRLGAVLGKKLCDLASVRQVLCVTHLPQLAAYGTQQLKVEKARAGGASTISVKAVEGQQRVDELALMLRGEAASAHTRAEAAAMLKEARAQAEPAVRKPSK
jgi:DNA repair protein RecN (Recombination protein N)